MVNEDVLYLSASELGERIRARRLSPVELTEAYLDRSRNLGPRLGAYVTLTPELALAEAQAAEREIRAGRYRGPLHGIPYAAKDLLAVKGYPTTWGARPYAEQRFAFDAAVIQRLRSAGAVLLGKAAMIELAGGMGYRYASAALTGPAHNPWNESCWTCGSSSGSGAIVAAALAGFAIGTETWGSIVCPSAFCGVSGLRPTFGRVSRQGAMGLAYSMDKIGPLARSAEDCGLVLAAIAGNDPADLGSLPPQDAAFTWPPAGAPKLRIGRLTNAWQSPAAEVEDAFQAALEVMTAHGAVVEDAALPEGPWEAAAGLTISVEGASAFQDLIESGRVLELADPEGQMGGFVNLQVGAADYERAQRLRGLLQRKMDTLFESFDLLTAPSLPVAASSLEANLDTDLSFADPLGGIGNFCGLPAASVPCGFTQAGLPIGIQFVGRVLGEDKVLAAARLFQQHSDWHRKRPPLS
ncbi:MAG TPA: amidase [Terriglobales bacterium]|nr:amidase [Terriglobales bacterium]